jgi:hypothetical protein
MKEKTGGKEKIDVVSTEAMIQETFLQTVKGSLTIIWQHIGHLYLPLKQSTGNTL